MGKRLGTWFAGGPWKEVLVGCVVVGVIVLVLGAFAPWPYVQNLAADFVGGLFAGLLIVALADAALGFTKKRQTEQRALRIAHDIVFPELMENQAELYRIAQAIRDGSFTLRDPVFAGDERLKAENWQLLVQSPLGEHLPGDLFWIVNWSYYVSRRFVRELRDADDSSLAARTPEAWKDHWREHLPNIVSAGESVGLAVDALLAAVESAKASK